MSVRAIVFDIYKTVLDVAPPAGDRDAPWDALACEWLGAPPRVPFPEFVAACNAIIAREHAKAHAGGIAKPEIFWPDVVAEVLPEVAALAPERRDAFLLEQQSLFHAVTLMPGAAAVLRTLRDGGVLLGIASNAQPYTLQEVGRALAKEGLTLAMFASDLCFWSFAHGFSKPDPHVFRLLTARFRMRDVRADEILMVGDRIDNDIMPAKAEGWQTWHFAKARTEGGGDWSTLGEFVASEVIGRQK